MLGYLRYLLDPIIWLVLCMLFGYILIYKKKRILATIFFTLGFSGIWSIVLFDPGQYLLIMLEDRFEKPQLSEIKEPKGFIILGGAVDTVKSDDRGEALLTDAAERVTVIPILMREFPDATFVFSGGSFGESSRGEGVFAQQYLDSIGFDSSKLELETQSRSTVENAKFTAMQYLSQEKDTADGWYLVTSAWHMPRAMGLFRKVGWDRIKAYPVDYRSGKKFHPKHRMNVGLRMYHVSIASKEMIALLVSYVGGYTDSIFPDDD